jgi:hypothetical protein
MLTHVEFRSDRFPAYEGEDEQTNPGLWGKRLAEFLRDKLPAEEGFRMWIGCGHYEEYPDGFLCFIEPHTPDVRKLFRKIDTRERVASLQRALDKVLSEADGIRAKRWWTHEEFNNPGASASLPR